MTNWLTYICFQPRSVWPELLLLWLDDGGVVPRTVVSNSLGPGPKSVTPERIAQIARARQLDWFVLDCGGETFDLAELQPKGFQQLCITGDERVADPILRHAVGLPGFVCALVGDGDDAFWQSANRLDIYNSRKVPLTGLSLIDDPIFGGKMIDVSQNPGRDLIGSGMRLWAASEMIFGPASFQIIPRERLMQCPVGEVEELVGGSIGIQLYSPSDAVSDIRDRQARFRAWVAMDELAEKPSPWEEDDPVLEIESGDYAHGGARLMTEWIDAGGRPVPRSRALFRRVSEFGRNGRRLWEAIDPPE